MTPAKDCGRGSRMTRRSFAGASLAAAPLLSRGQSAPTRPNILWITCEDIGPHLGCYGDTYANTPNLDSFASSSLRYSNAWSNAPVCAPARTTIISGMYPTSTGSHHMRSLTSLPQGLRMYPQYLREAGYYATNNVKEDYNLVKPGEVWDDSSSKAHYKNRASGQPFFSIFNFTITHESQIRTRPHQWVHDPQKVTLPPYHPDTLEVRQDWAQYYDNITTMDGQAGKVLRELEQSGLAEQTIVFFYGDHGSGMPRNKRSACNSGLNVPFMVRIPDAFAHLRPEGYRAGGVTERLVGFIDLAPTLLSLAGLSAPKHFQGHAFLGPHTRPEPEYLYGFRGRMDERYDMVHSVRDKRYVYVRNYMPHKPAGQHNDYMFQTPTTRVWKKLYDEGKLNDTQRQFFDLKAHEELYDLQNDPHEVKNLAQSRDHAKILSRMREAEYDWVIRTRHVDFLPEPEIHTRAQNSTPYQVAQNQTLYPLSKIAGAAQAAAGLDSKLTRPLAASLSETDSAIRYWGAMGLLMRGSDGFRAGHDELLTAMQRDSSPSVKIVAAEAIARYGTDEEVNKAIPLLVEFADASRNQVFVAMLALNALDSLGARVAPWKGQIEKLPQTTQEMEELTRSKDVLNRLITSVLGNIPAQEKAVPPA
jgi:arylsulfatase A-like enzyme